MIKVKWRIFVTAIVFCSCFEISVQVKEGTFETLKDCKQKCPSDGGDCKANGTEVFYCQCHPSRTYHNGECVQIYKEIVNFIKKKAYGWKGVGEVSVIHGGVVVTLVIVAVVLIASVIHYFRVLKKKQMDIRKKKALIRRSLFASLRNLDDDSEKSASSTSLEFTDEVDDRVSNKNSKNSIDYRVSSYDTITEPKTYKMKKKNRSTRHLTTLYTPPLTDRTSHDDVPGIKLSKLNNKKSSYKEPSYLNSPSSPTSPVSWKWPPE